VSIDIALCEFHMILPTAANPAHSKASRSRRISSDRWR
jgi:hypothetical protein